jgi:hypothetical protein
MIKFVWNVALRSEKCKENYGQETQVGNTTYSDLGICRKTLKWNLKDYCGIETIGELSGTLNELLVATNWGTS